MRRRRLYRYSQQAKGQPQWSPRRVEEVHPAQLSEYEQGIRRGIELARQQQGHMVAEARREALVAAHSEPFIAMARRGGYDEGFAAGMRSAAQNPQQKGAQFTYSDLENARRRGVEEGRAQRVKSGMPNVDEDSVRRKAIDDMLENCRVVAESNPNMTSESFFKAIKQRSKKLK